MSPRRRIAGEKRRPASAERALPEEADARLADASSADATPRDGAPDDAAPDDAAPATAAPDAAAPSAKPPRRPWGRRTRALVIVSVVVAVVAVAYAAIAFFTVNGVENDATDRVDVEAEATTAAVAAIPEILGYSHETIDEDLEGATEFMTDDFAAEYSELAPQVSSLAEQRELVVTAGIVEDSIAPLSCGQECSPSEVRLLAFVDQERTLAGKPGSPAALSVVLRMEKVDGTWLVAELTTT
ncbi:hypothetical protein CLV56_2552 [Mumia flava]|uniref:Mce-associated membrane protein n=1 Tax=Mumia flava TaxID=1348852 RepID=A0A0B2BID6_9ACTN|nr:hypothetical protein [Mumia flava]PJJ58301.1 hypothetical protein CLV56_2552 [Mumia flava]